MSRLLTFITVSVVIAFAFVLLRTLDESLRSEIRFLFFGILVFGAAFGAVLVFTTKLDAGSQSRGGTVKTMKWALEDAFSQSAPPTVRQRRAAKLRTAMFIPGLLFVALIYFLSSGGEREASFDTLDAIQTRQGLEWLHDHIPAGATNIFVTINPKIGYRWFRYEMTDAEATFVPHYAAKVDLARIINTPHKWPQRDVGWVSPALDGRTLLWQNRRRIDLRRSVSQ